jgi:hypothetical protein
MTFIVCILLCVIQVQYKIGQSTQQILKLRRTTYYTYYTRTTRFIGADVDAPCFDLSLDHLQAYIKQQ